MNFPSIDIQGSILSTDLLGRIRSEQALYQQGKDFKPNFSNSALKDEISFAWQEVRGQWTIYKSKLARLKDGESATTETRNFWISPLLTNLGYNLTFDRKAEEINGKSFAIGYRDSVLDNFPIFVGGFYESLDKRPDNLQLRVSPHALMQEYLNSSEHLYGIVTNGRFLRLLRDATRITRLSYLEFNLEKILEEDLYSDFVILYRLLHASRMPMRKDLGADSIIEKYHQEGLESGSAIRSKLGDAVKTSILNLANGFINHPANFELRQIVDDGNLNTDEYYRHQLRIIYRLLFLFVIEERNLVYADSKTPETKRFAQIYYNHYSLLRLRKAARKLSPPEAERHYDIWQGLLSTFSLFEDKVIGEKLGIMSLQGDLFGYNAINSRFYDLHKCLISNAVLLDIIKSLGYFENENKVLIAVNYGGLDVEEFGSVYEGLLELKININKIVGSDRYSCSFDTSNERSKSGSHYTPEELVQPLIKHSLDYLIADKLKEKDPEAALLALKVADVACGSGHILLSAARRISHELACLYETRENNSREKVEQPSPPYMRKAMKDVVRNCIYGVDKNPLAVELCKIALWLEAYNPGEPLNFLDHHIKCGDAIVGLAHRDELENGIADEAFKLLPGDDKDICKTFRDKNIKEKKLHEAKAMQLKAEFEKTTGNSVQEAMAEYKTFRSLPETTPDEIDKKAKAYQKFMQGKGYSFLKAMADTQIAQFFIPKTTENKEVLITDADYRQILGGWQGWQDRKISHASIVALENRFFHWFLEFPEVFQNGGFDCVLGNPPFLGGKKISGAYGDDYLMFLKNNYEPVSGGVDYVAYFLRRIFEIIRDEGFQAIISTNTISQGDTREGGLSVIKDKGGNIIYCDKNVRWPGLATVEVSLISIYKGKWFGKFILDNKEVEAITSYFDDNLALSLPYSLKSNQNKSFQGSIILGQGFVLTQQKADNIISIDKKYSNVIFPYLSGDNFSNNPDQLASRFVINFFDWELDFCKIEYPICFEIVERLVKPEREKVKRTVYRNNWWLYAEKGINLYNAIKGKKKIIAVPLVSKHSAINFVESGNVYSNKLGIFTLDTWQSFCILQSTIHNIWGWKFASTLGAGTLNYSNTICFEPFPFPNIQNSFKEQKANTIGETYHNHRRQLMLKMQLGLTKTYNAFHAIEIQIGIKTSDLQDLDHKAIEKNYGKEVWNLWNHLQKTPETCSIKEAIEGIVKLRELHVEMDLAVLEAYNWTDVDLKHDFYEVDYLPENDRIRYTIHPEARKEILKRLLELNHEQYEDEIRQGLHKEADVKKFYEQKGMEVPAGTKFSDKGPKPYKIAKAPKSNKLNEPELGFGE